MKRNIALAAAITCSALLAGCASQNVSQPAVPLQGTVKTDLKADVRVGEPIHGQSSMNVLFGVIKLGKDNQYADGVVYGGGESGFASLGIDPVSSAKSAAAFKAVKSAGADLIVAPRYEVDVNDYFIFKTVNVKVTGQKGTIAGIR